jgi:hypothetical protein
MDRPEITTLKRANRERWSSQQLFDALPHIPRARFKIFGFRFKSGPKPLGVPVIDEIRTRAEKMNLTLTDLDEISGGGSYWQGCTAHLRWRHISKVIEFMGGELRVDFAAATLDD